MYTVIVVKFIKSMPQRRQEQTAEIKIRKKRGGGERGRSRKWGEGEINIETVDHENRTPGSRWAEGGMHHI